MTAGRILWNGVNYSVWAESRPSRAHLGRRHGAGRFAGAGKRVLRIYTDADGNTQIQELPIATKPGQNAPDGFRGRHRIDLRRLHVQLGGRLASDSRTAIFYFAFGRN